MVAPVADEFRIGIQNLSPSALTLQQATTELTKTCVLPIRHLQTPWLILPSAETEVQLKRVKTLSNPQ